MPRIQLHPASLALGIVLTGLCFLSMSQATVSTPLRVEYIAHPKDSVQIAGGAPYAVPPGKILTLTAFGNADGPVVGAFLRVNGQREFSVSTGNSGGTFVSECSIVQRPAGFTLPAGAVLELAQPNSVPPFYAINPSHRAWGYLVNQ